MQPTEVMQRFRLSQMYAFVPTLEEEQEEARRQELIKGQRKAQGAQECAEVDVEDMRKVEACVIRE